MKSLIWMTQTVGLTQTYSIQDRVIVYCKAHKHHDGNIIAIYHNDNNLMSS